MMSDEVNKIALKALATGFILGIITMLGMAVVIVKNGWFK